ncbi:MAG: PTS lactose/cellobiose transporter subunit IIA [Erysipelotrichaceae bacterium]|uniref:PTS lactose/cellobiose transporter subunit IIA n=2 Tax=Anaerorhabdus sp. TaxID=1872524 RepID=UPI002FC946B2
MEGLELTCFQIISAVGTARSLYIEAIQDAKEGKFDDAKAKIKEGEEVFVEGHKVHAELVQKEANGEEIKFQLLLLHAEDQLMSAEAFSIIAKEFIDLYEIIKK